MLRRFCEKLPFWTQLQGKKIVLSGATGMLGSVLTDAVMLHNQELTASERCRLVVLGRDEAKARRRFPNWFAYEEFQFLEYDMRSPLGGAADGADYVLHAASTTHPIAYASEPIDTVLTNVLGAWALLELSVKAGARFLMLSSVEVYGQARGDAERLSEEYCGYIDCNTLRAGYPESKRTAEALCQAYRQEKGVDAVIIRLPRCYGPTMQAGDSKAAAQFIANAVAGQDITLKSDGSQQYSFLYAPDAVEAMLWVLLKGASGQAYNAADIRSDITLLALAELCARCGQSNVVYALPDDLEKSGYSTAHDALLDPGKLHRLGWRARYAIDTGIQETICILREMRGDMQ